MHRSGRWLKVIPFLAVALCVNAASADPGHGNGPKPGKGHKPDNAAPLELRATLAGLQEVPTVISDGHGTFRATVNDAGDMISYVLSYSDLNGAVTQAHIHVGQRFAAGGISVFLCSNLSMPPPNTQTCPSPPAQIMGTITADNVIGPAAQGVGTGELADLMRAIRAGAAYVNVHSDISPTGEIRGQIHSSRPED